ncbi:formimidoylglutamase [Bdellovibrionota bacterium FG-1]
MSQRSKYCLIGIPDHQGVLHVGGRIGSAQGPQAVRKILARMIGKAGLADRIWDAGDVQGLSSDVAANHRLAADQIRDLHRSVPGTVSVVIGGGHDHSFSQLLGISEGMRRTKGAQRKLRLGCINIDPHLDVRKPAPIPTSGSPFYLAIESGVLDPSRLIEFGIQAHCNGPALWAYAQKKKIKIIPFEKLRTNAVAIFKKQLTQLCACCDVVVVSLDLDSAAEAFAPGVSAPQTEGFSSSELLDMVEISARTAKVASLGIFELNPVHDIADRTARLAATLAWHFLEKIR